MALPRALGPTPCARLPGARRGRRRGRPKKAKGEGRWAGRPSYTSAMTRTPQADRTALVTGASSGLGRALAVELAGRGYDLFLTARRVDRLASLREELASRHPGRRAVVRRLDVTDPSEVTAAVDEAAGAFGRLGLVVANAGIGGSTQVGSGGLGRDRGIVETDLLGAMATVDAAVACFRRQGGPGQVVGIASVAGFRGLPGAAAYSASKAALLAYLDAVRAETFKEPITVTTISPGYVVTELDPDLPRRPFVIEADRAARLMADAIEAGTPPTPSSPGGPGRPWRPSSGSSPPASSSSAGP